MALAATLFLAGTKLVDPPGADLIVLGGACVAGVAVLVGLARWFVRRPAVGDGSA